MLASPYSCIMVVRMRDIYKILISFFVALLITFQYGTYAQVCHCVGMTPSKHSCCDDSQPQPCHQSRQDEQKASLKESATQHSCPCSISPTPSPVVENENASSVVPQLVLSESSKSISFHSLDFSIAQKPIWLHQLYNPDRSNDYLTLSRLLI